MDILRTFEVIFLLVSVSKASPMPSYGSYGGYVVCPDGTSPQKGANNQPIACSKQADCSGQFKCVQVLPNRPGVCCVDKSVVPTTESTIVMTSAPTYGPSTSGVPSTESATTVSVAPSTEVPITEVSPVTEIVPVTDMSPVVTDGSVTHVLVPDASTSTYSVPAVDTTVVTDMVSVTGGVVVTDTVPTIDSGAVTGSVSVITDTVPVTGGVPVTDNGATTDGVLITDNVPVTDGILVTDNVSVTDAVSVTDNGVPVTETTGTSGISASTETPIGPVEISTISTVQVTDGAPVTTGFAATDDVPISYGSTGINAETTVMNSIISTTVQSIEGGSGGLPNGNPYELGNPNVDSNSNHTQNGESTTVTGVPVVCEGDNACPLTDSVQTTTAATEPLATPDSVSSSSSTSFPVDNNSSSVDVTPSSTVETSASTDNDTMTSLAPETEQHTTEYIDPTANCLEGNSWDKTDMPVEVSTSSVVVDAVVVTTGIVPDGSHATTTLPTMATSDAVSSSSGHEVSSGDVVVVDNCTESVSSALTPELSQTLTTELAPAESVSEEYQTVVVTPDNGQLTNETVSSVDDQSTNPYFILTQNGGRTSNETDVLDSSSFGMMIINNGTGVLEASSAIRSVGNHTL